MTHYKFTKYARCRLDAQVQSNHMRRIIAALFSFSQNILIWSSLFRFGLRISFAAIMWSEVLITEYAHVASARYLRRRPSGDGGLFSPHVSEDGRQRCARGVE